MRIRISSLLVCGWLAICAATLVKAAPVGTGFTYQGRLDNQGVPADGACSLRFTLWDDDAAGSQIGGLVEVPVTLVDGTFSAEIDFGGGAFNGDKRWMEISVLCDGDPGWTTLSPRQPINAGPYAVYATSGPGGGGNPWTPGAYGIEYLGHVGIGTAAHGGRQLVVDTGTNAVNPFVVSNNNASYGTCWIRNFAPGGIGIYDADSDKHFLDGRLGLRTLSPEAQLHIVSASSTGAKVEASADGVSGTMDAAVWAKGSGSSFTSSCVGVFAESTYGSGVVGVANGPVGYGGLFTNTGGGPALYADGLAQVKTLQILGGADLVEGFATSDEAATEPGTVVVIDAKSPGQLATSTNPYDRKVAGVVSGAGGVSAGIHLSQVGALEGETPLAMSGRVWVKCSAENGEIEPGDLLTTASTAGHAMKATDGVRSQGAVIGKSMGALDEGTGLVLVLVNLQ